MNLLNGILLIAVGMMFLAIARDKVLWRSHALESFRYCSGVGCVTLGGRFVWIHMYGDELGVSLWTQFALFAVAVGQLGILVDKLTPGRIRVPKFLRKALE